MTNNKGFTLVELMLVVILIGIVAGFSIPNYQRAVARAYLRDARNNLIIIREANQVYRAQQGTYWPTAVSVEDLAAINTNLRLNILANGVTYTCTGIAGFTTFSCSATRAGNWGFTSTVTQVSIFVPPACATPANCNPSCTDNDANGATPNAC